MEPRSVPQLATAMQQLHKKGFVETIKEGPQGVGKTLEAALNVSRGQSGTQQRPDLGIGVKVKAKQKDSKSRMTLFTKSPDTSETDETPGSLLRKFGDRKRVEDDVDHDITLYKNPAGQSNDFEIDITDGNLRIITPYGDVYGIYSMRDLREQFRDRFQYLLISEAEKDSFRGKTLYRYTSADFYYDVSLDRWEDAILNGDVILEFRMACDEGEFDSPRDRGVGWRMYVEDLVGMYDSSADLLDESLTPNDLPSTPQKTLTQPDPDSFDLFVNHSR